MSSLFCAFCFSQQTGTDHSNQSGLPLVSTFAVSFIWFTPDTHLAIPTANRSQVVCYIRATLKTLHLYPKIAIFGIVSCMLCYLLVTWDTPNSLAIRVFSQLSDLTFLSFLYKIDFKGYQNQQKKIASTGYWIHNTNPTLRIPAPLTTLPPRHLLNRIFLNWTWIISGSIEHDFRRVWKFETGMDWQIGWVGKGAGILIVGLVLWVQYPVEAIFFCWFWNPVM